MANQKKIELSILCFDYQIFKLFEEGVLTNKHKANKYFRSFSFTSEKPQSTWRKFVLGSGSELRLLVKLLLSGLPAGTRTILSEE